jgi:hypothetical protein
MQEEVFFRSKVSILFEAGCMAESASIVRQRNGEHFSSSLSWYYLSRGFRKIGQPTFRLHCWALSVFLPAQQVLTRGNTKHPKKRDTFTSFLPLLFLYIIL